jgi:hypothetical protein
LIWAGISSVAGRAGGRFFFATLVHHRRPQPVPPPLGQQLNGQVQLAYEPSGFIYSLDVPLSSIIAA